MATSKVKASAPKKSPSPAEDKKRLKARDHKHDDLVIAGPDGQIWQISQDALQRNFKVDVSSTNPSDQHIIELLKSGVTVAYMPPPPGATATGNAMCYLINLSGINTSPTAYQDTPKPKKGKKGP